MNTHGPTMQQKFKGAVTHIQKAKLAMPGAWGEWQGAHAGVAKAQQLPWRQRGRAAACFSWRCVVNVPALLPSMQTRALAASVLSGLRSKNTRAEPAPPPFPLRPAPQSTSRLISSTPPSRRSASR